uniref:Uncharacterized protein n=1 Tax=Chromera velia CCMP2878 TaxID=1169474 RepID=A0A0G4GNV3_9ALVE|eukprot:Cvel_22710.t1-p1 / transcript=Cvel_22710.t1 / gene=Cvel_22710 / organism=Chromera_velia_CCMP2878 / gene_product=hypothetical protein / transcript_product=hypothetical protein / location=Cvel_scaffold2262:17786-19603(+) / protein_length=497 / sequence_SO=supercontig / SO=protein_coding / is_pseudo=false
MKGPRQTQWMKYDWQVRSLHYLWGPYNILFKDYCDSFLYSYANTFDYSWLDTQLQNEYYEKAREVVDKGGVVFAHSMANSLLAGACWQQNKCVQFYGLGGVLSGVILSNVLKKDFLGKPLYWFGQVVLDSFNTKSRGMRRDPDEATQNALMKNTAAKKLFKGNLCGGRPQGNGGGLSDGFGVDQFLDFFGTIVSREVQKVEPEIALKGGGMNDGLVELASCAFYMENGSARWFADTDTGTSTSQWPSVTDANANPQDKFLIAQVNHMEENGMYPDVTPVVMNWVRNMMCDEIGSDGGNAACANRNSPLALPSQSEEGYRCALGRDCGGEHTCCQNFCRQRIKDWAGIPYCPHECVGRPGWDPGTCLEPGRIHSPRWKGEECLLHTDCAGGGLGGSVGCCEKKCTDLQKDHMNVNWCPHECKGRPDWGPGTCSDPGKWHWPRHLGEGCGVHEDCEGGGLFASVGCCKGTCTQKKQDWAHVWYCPDECVGRIFGPRGSC